MMLGASVASFLFIMGSSVFGMPISGTHSVIGGLVGAGLAGCGWDSINKQQILRIVASWFLSPLISAGLCFTLVVIVTALTLGGIKLRFKVKVFALTVISGLCFVLINFMVFIKLIRYKGEAP